MNGGNNNHIPVTGRFFQPEGNGFNNFLLEDYSRGSSLNNNSNHSTGSTMNPLLVTNNNHNINSNAWLDSQSSNMPGAGGPFFLGSGSASAADAAIGGTGSINNINNFDASNSNSNNFLLTNLPPTTTNLESNYHSNSNSAAAAAFNHLNSHQKRSLASAMLTSGGGGGNAVGIGGSTSSSMPSSPYYQNLMLQQSSRNNTIYNTTTTTTGTGIGSNAAEAADVAASRNLEREILGDFYKILHTGGSTTTGGATEPSPLQPLLPQQNHHHHHFPLSSLSDTSELALSNRGVGGGMPVGGIDSAAISLPYSFQQQQQQLPSQNQQPNSLPRDNSLLRDNHFDLGFSSNLNSNSCSDSEASLWLALQQQRQQQQQQQQQRNDLNNMRSQMEFSSMLQQANNNNDFHNINNLGHSLENSGFASALGGNIGGVGSATSNNNYASLLGNNNNINGSAALNSSSFGTGSSSNTDRSSLLAALFADQQLPSMQPSSVPLSSLDFATSLGGNHHHLSSSLVGGVVGATNPMLSTTTGCFLSAAAAANQQSVSQLQQVQQQKQSFLQGSSSSSATANAAAAPGEIGDSDTTRRPSLPFRALSAYNFFFRDERDRIINGGEMDLTPSKKQQLLSEHWFRDRSVKRRHRKTHGKIAFTTLSKVISQAWRDLPENMKVFYKELASEDLDRYQREIDQYKMIDPAAAAALAATFSPAPGQQLPGMDDSLSDSAKIPSSLKKYHPTTL